MAENEVKNQEQEQSAFEYDDGLYGKKIEPTPVPEKNIGVDQHDVLVNTFADEGTSSKIDVSAIEKFTNISQNRNEVYTLLDSMAEDPTIASALEIYATEATEYNDEGKIVWCESSDENVSKYVTFLLDSMNIDKNIYKWAYSLCKYGDLYLRLYRDSDYQDPIFDKVEGDRKDKKKSLTEKLNEIKEEEFNKKNGEKLDESVKIVVHGKNDKYVHYIDMVADPATMFELTKFGKTYGYIKAPNNMIVKREYGVATDDLFRYSFKQQDVEVFQPDDYVHACIEDNSSRQQETVSLSLGDKDNDESSKYTYTVRRGKSILMTAFKIWREMMLLENSILLNRVTKSSIFRIFGIEIGDMPKEQVGPYLDRFKNMVEQRLAFNVDKSMNEYNNPGPIENIIYVPTRNGQGSVSTQEVGGDVDVKGLADLDYFRQKLSGGLRIPQQYLGWTDGATGFNGGTSLSIVSARFAKEVKRVQNTLVQALTDAVNLMLWDKGLTNYINNFEIHMLPPTTQEDIDRRDNLSSRVGIIRDIINLTDAVEDTSKKLKILKSLLSDVVTDSDVITVIQEKIDELEAEGEEGVSTGEGGSDDTLSPEGSDSSSEADTTDLGSLFGDTEEPETFTPETSGGEETAETEAPEETVGELPSPDSLGIDFTQNQNF